MSIEDIINATQWLSFEDYNLLFPSYPIAEDTYDELERAACEDINFVTSGKINEIGHGNLEMWVQDRISQAVGYQVIFYASEGGLYNLSDSDASSVSVGKFSISGGQNSQNLKPFTINGRRVSPKIRELLADTNLLYAGVKGF